MIVKIFFFVFLCCSEYCGSYRINGQTPWYAVVDRFGVHYSSRSYARNAPSTNQDKLIACGAEEFECKSIHQCISNKQICDGRVNCVDASDETNCTCISRLNPSKICDNYDDCPDRSDEMGCFGCKNDSYSCHYNENEYIANSRQSECYTDIEKCDAILECANAKDESDCLLLTRSTDGFLFSNLKNQWYPVCNDLSNWSRQACEHEIGVRLSDDSISTVYEPFIYDGKYVSSVKYRNKIFPRLVDNCSVTGIESANAILRVKCPDICGARIDFETEKPNHSLRIAGGKEVAPGSHRWLVSLHLNGRFICSGNIIGQKWILTAAHCLKRKRYQVTHDDYLEVRAGVLRKTSFSPQEQVIRVLRAVIHSGYEMKSFKSDIALLELNKPLLYNRWVQPICLPTQERVSNKTDSNWMWNIKNTTCLTAGWGGFTDRGTVPEENLMEVELPISSDCDPNNIGVFCAGHPEGGFDTCIGDSGGAFACRSNSDHTEFYLAGITSSSYNPEKTKQGSNRCGEPNTFTTFTRMSFFATEIDTLKLDTTNEIFLHEKCPGVLCKSNNRCVRALNGIVDCLDGEDETY